MTKSYDPAHPTDMDKVRALIPDTGVEIPAGSGNATYLLTDEQINLELAGSVNIYRAGAGCCQIIAGMFAQSDRNENQGGNSFSLNRSKNMLNRADELNKRAKIFEAGGVDPDTFYDEQVMAYEISEFGEDNTDYYE